MGEPSSKRPGSPSTQIVGKRLRTSVIPYRYSFEHITAANCELCIPELSRETQLTDLNIATGYCNPEGKSFLAPYRQWVGLRAFSQLDEHFLRFYLINSRQARLKTLPLHKLAIATVTFADIFFTAKLNGQSDVALAAANKVLDYVICCYCTGQPIEAIERLMPDFSSWFDEAGAYVKAAGPRTSIHALNHSLSRPQDGIRRDSSSFTGFVENIDHPPTVVHPPINIGNAALPAGNTIAVGSGANGNGADVDGDLNAHIQACIVNQYESMSWDKIVIRSAVKLRIRTTLEVMSRDNVQT